MGLGCLALFHGGKIGRWGRDVPGSAARSLALRKIMIRHPMAVEVHAKVDRSTASRSKALNKARKVDFLGEWIRNLVK